MISPQNCVVTSEQGWQIVAIETTSSSVSLSVPRLRLDILDVLDVLNFTRLVNLTLVKEAVNSLQSTKIIHLEPLPIYSLNVDTTDVTIQDITIFFSYIMDGVVFTYILFQCYLRRDRLKVKLLACKNYCFTKDKPQAKIDNREINVTNNTGPFEMIEKDQGTSSIARTQVIPIERENYDTVRHAPSAPDMMAEKIYPYLPTGYISRVPYKKRCVKRVTQTNEQPGDMGITQSLNIE
jgi:hypothetical protein